MEAMSEHIIAAERAGCRHAAPYARHETVIATESSPFVAGIAYNTEASGEIKRV